MVDNRKLLSVHRKIKLALENIEKEEGIKIDFSDFKYTNSKYCSKITILSNEYNDNLMLINCKRVGFTQNILGMKFISKNGIYEIVDIRPRNSKYPVIAKSSDGKYWKYSVNHIKSLLGGDSLINRNINLKKLI